MGISEGLFYGVQCVSTKSNASLGADLRNLPGAMGQALFLNVTPKEPKGKLRLLYGPHQHPLTSSSWPPLCPHRCV